MGDVFRVNLVDETVQQARNILDVALAEEAEEAVPEGSKGADDECSAKRVAVLQQDGREDEPKNGPEDTGHKDSHPAVRFYANAASAVADVDG